MGNRKPYPLLSLKSPPLTNIYQNWNSTNHRKPPSLTSLAQVDGKIVAPLTQSDWASNDFQWILFSGFSNGLTIRGNGLFDGHGEAWWVSKYLDTYESEFEPNYFGPKNKPVNYRPHALRIGGSANVTVTGITIQNTPKMHIFIGSSQYVTIYNLTVSSPGNSPNTDGIHLTSVQHADIHNSTLACGDDCVSIQTGCSDVVIYDVDCGPGHGYSIGGLGPDGKEAQVSKINVVNSTVADSLTGVRIKTWPGGFGSVHDVKFSNITMTDVKTPIVIDQNYCGGSKYCNMSLTNKAVAISGISYENIRGTYTYRSVSLACSIYNPCRNLTIDTIDLNPSEGNGNNEPHCSNAYGDVIGDTTPPLEDCLLPCGAPAPARMPKDGDYLFGLF
ncbi:hypothetical protein BUALT_Bualt04G0160000 [Buddleja alternifolia]|uniref:Polygalacturonase n=1 Tax=Buddleja alternifolia TaxID=168488 RepID=A0AAV6XRH1_9LAMI|nr:hypothetical protein BUALT_Bualt04G0160000 [Buddleja alternifolia]